jgi:dTDP-4-amino-4,6-dideoxygalactose transaminase
LEKNVSQIEFIDLQAQRAYLGSRIDEAIARVLEHGRFIMGPEVKTLEGQLSKFGGVERTVSCSSGTDAILLPLLGWEIGAGDAVFLPSFTFASTAEVVVLAGATPVFIDIHADTFNMDPAHLAQAIDEVKKQGKLTPRAVIVVDLFGQIADYPAIKKITDKHGLKLISDAAQGFGSTLKGEQAGAFADVVTTSFFPAKPLGCYGDGGAVLTNDPAIADIMESLRVHGKGGDKYDNIRVGMNARLDTLQAAILIEKLSIFAEEIDKRNTVAARYNDALSGLADIPLVIEGAVSTWAQYTLKLADRDRVQARLKEVGIPSAVYYPKPLHQQTAYKNYPVGGNGLPVSDRLPGEVLSLPMHPYMSEDVQDQIIDQLVKALS